MKALIPLLLVTMTFFSAGLKANTVESVFAQGTALPSPLRPKILKAVQDELPCLKSFSLQELKTQVKTDQIDQGITDEYFTTTFQASAYLDQYPPYPVKISVKSLNLDIANPQFERYRVLEVSPEYYCD